MLLKEENPKLESQCNITLEAPKGEAVGNMNHLYPSQALSTLGSVQSHLAPSCTQGLSKQQKLLVFRHFKS